VTVQQAERVKPVRTQGPTFDGYQSIASGLSPDDRLDFFAGLPEEVQGPCWANLAREAAEWREQARLADPDGVFWQRRPRLGRLWQSQPNQPNVANWQRDRNHGPDRRKRGCHDDDEVLRRIPPPTYFEVLAGIAVPPQGGKVLCPFHDERTPSCHAYAEAARGFFCFSCGAGGGIFDFASRLWNIGTQGADFIELRQRIARELLA
jgi:hypothetical protein